MSWKRICNGLLGPDIPVHLRDDFTLLTARHMRGQARLLFVGFILSLPMVVLGASPGAGPLVAYGQEPTKIAGARCQYSTQTEDRGQSSN